jgi:hypothetical protein
MNNDYNDFIETKKTVPDHLSNSVINLVNSDLNPSHKVVFAKLTLIQSFIGLITMIFCPQFDFSLTNNYDLFHYFHLSFGHQICMIICGSIFLGSGAVFASYVLKEGEVNKIKESRFLYYMALSIIAVSTFMLFGAEIYLSLVVFWIMGAIGGGIIAFELNRIIRKQIINL